MNKIKKDILFVILAFLGPLGVVLLPSLQHFSLSEKKCLVEGLWIFSIYILLTLILTSLAGIPFIGLAFSIFNNLLFFIYLISILVIIFKKSAEENFEIPFATFYAKRIIKMAKL